MNDPQPLSAWDFRADTNTDDVAALDRFLDNDGDLMDGAAEAIKLLCTLKSMVARSGATTFPDTPSDCFCEDWQTRTRDEGWRNGGDELRFIIRATLRELGREKARQWAARADVTP